MNQRLKPGQRKPGQQIDHGFRPVVHAFEPTHTLEISVGGTLSLGV